MKGIFAAIIAVVVLWIVDANFNGGKYTVIVLRMIRSLAHTLGWQV